MGEKCSGPDVDPATFFLLGGDVAPLLNSNDMVVRWAACHFLGSVLLVQLKSALGICPLYFGGRRRGVSRASDCRNTHGRLPVVGFECNQ